MKKVLFIALFTVIGLGNLKAQDASFGVTAGYHMFSPSASSSDVTASTNLSGFYGGFFGEFKVAEKLSIQPEIHFASTRKDGESFNELILPIVAKYYISNEFNVQAGPQLDYVLEEGEGNKFGIGLAVGAGYDITENIFISSRYSFGLNNRLKNTPSDVSTRFNTFQVGLGYRF